MYPECIELRISYVSHHSRLFIALREKDINLTLLYGSSNDDRASLFGLVGDDYLVFLQLIDQMT